MRSPDQIVEELRKLDEKAQVVSSQERPFSVFGEAVDEIERLRNLYAESADQACDLRTELRELSARTEVAPIGWKLVPQMPTQAMLDLARCGFDQNCPFPCACEVAYQNAWVAMFKAAPPTPQHGE